MYYLVAFVCGAIAGFIFGFFVGKKNGTRVVGVLKDTVGKL